LFFVLSGFLITRILLINGEECARTGTSVWKALKTFYVRRILRIFPVYYLLLFFLLVIDYKNTHNIFLWIATFSSNIYQSVHNVYIGDFNHFWSLAVEEQFYLFWPFLIFFVKPRFRLFSILAIIVLAILYKFYLFSIGANWMAISYSTISCMNALGLGALAAYLTLYREDVAAKIVQVRVLLPVLTVYVLLLFVGHYYSIAWYLVIGDEFLFAIASSLIILKASQNGFEGILKNILENKFVIYSGKVSYGMYLFHLFAPTLLGLLFGVIGCAIPGKYYFAIGCYALTFLLAHLSWRFIESPINKLKSRFNYNPN
jgi:peptidoglycan/LPS O-acetylase OafA/YrhL